MYIVTQPEQATRLKVTAWRTVANINIELAVLSEFKQIQKHAREKHVSLESSE